MSYQDFGEGFPLCGEASCGEHHFPEPEAADTTTLFTDIEEMLSDCEGELCEIVGEVHIERERAAVESGALGMCPEGPTQKAKRGER